MWHLLASSLCWLNRYGIYLTPGKVMICDICQPQACVESICITYYMYHRILCLLAPRHEKTPSTFDLIDVGALMENLLTNTHSLWASRIPTHILIWHLFFFVVPFFRKCTFVLKQHDNTKQPLLSKLLQKKRSSKVNLRRCFTTK
jgi:hypothetical protein